MSRFDTLNQLEEDTCRYPPYDSRALLRKLDAVCKVSECETCSIPATREQKELLGDKDE